MYPITYEADQAEKRNRLTTFFRYIVAIPWYIVAYLYSVASQFAALFAWFAIVFTGRYPESLYNFNAGYLRMSTRTNSFIYLLTDEWPSFDGDDHPDYPVRIGIAEPLDTYNRWKTGFRFIVGIPVMFLALIWGIVIGVVAFVAWFAILFTGKLGDGLLNPMRSAMTYLTRTSAYFLLMTEDYPPFSENSSAEPAGQISSTSKAAK